MSQGIIDSYFGKLDAVDWPTVNGLLLKRYRPSGLEYIKKLAWQRDGFLTPKDTPVSTMRQAPHE